MLILRETTNVCFFQRRRKQPLKLHSKLRKAEGGDVATGETRERENASCKLASFFHSLILSFSSVSVRRRGTHVGKASWQPCSLALPSFLYILVDDIPARPARHAVVAAPSAWRVVARVLARRSQHDSSSDECEAQDSSSCHHRRRRDSGGGGVVLRRSL